MGRIKRLILTIHRRSLWQVTGIYLGTGWLALRVADHVAEKFLLPEWVYGTTFIILLAGFPIVLATAFVEERTEAQDPPPGGPAGGPEPVESVAVGGPEPSTPVREEAGTPGGGAAGPKDADVRTSVGRWLGRALSWPRTILGGLIAFSALGLVSVLVVSIGAARVTEARGSAGDAFEKRAWIVVADFESPQGESETILAAQTALTVDLQQSEFVNVYGRNQLSPVLERMGLPDTTRLTEGLALEVAQREGLAVVLAASMSRLGVDYVFSARVIEPNAGRELIAVRTAARADRLLEGIERLSREVRRRLGEAGDEIGGSRPLPQVTTGSLEALKKYARAVEALELARDDGRAADLADEAIDLDSTFAMAHRLAAVAKSNQRRLGEAVAHITRAYEYRDRLTDRERLHVEAFYHYLVPFDPRRAAVAYEELLARYPDDFRAVNNFGTMSYVFLGEAEGGYQAFRRALELNPYSALAYENALSAAVYLGREGDVDSLIHRMQDLGLDQLAVRWSIGRAFAHGHLNRADALCDSVLTETRSREWLADYRRSCGANDLARGRLARAVQRLQAAARYYAERRRHVDAVEAVRGSMRAEERAERPGRTVTHLRLILDRFPASSMAERDRTGLRSTLIAATSLLGRSDLLERVEAAYPEPDTSHWFGRYHEWMAAAARAIGRGEARRAVELLRRLSSGEYQLSSVSNLSPLHIRPTILRGLAFDTLGQADSAAAYYAATIEPADLIDPWRPVNRALLSIVLPRLAELEAARGNRSAAAGHYRRLLNLWSNPDPKLEDAVANARRALQRLSE